MVAAFLVGVAAGYRIATRWPNRHLDFADRRGSGGQGRCGGRSPARRLRVSSTRWSRCCSARLRAASWSHSSPRRGSLPRSCSRSSRCAGCSGHRGWENREIRGPTYLIFLALTLLNPPTVIYFVSLAVARPEASQDLASRAAFVARAFLSFLSWQELHAVAGAMLQRRLTRRLQRVTAVVSSVIILGLAARIAFG